MYSSQQDLLPDKILVSIPINLANRRAIACSLLDKYDMDYLFMGDIFQDRTTNEFCRINIYDRKMWIDDNLNVMSLFKLLGQNQLSSTTLEQIDNCQQIIHLISDDVGYDICFKIAKFTQVFLNIGGIAVQVDSAGIVHERDKWLANYNSEDVFDIYSLFVTLVRGDNEYYSCGMNNFGKADVSIDITENINLAIYIMNVFNYYRLTESVIIRDGQTFQPDIECPIYKIKWSEGSEYEINNPLHNPYGNWHLSRVTDDLDITYKVN